MSTSGKKTLSATEAGDKSLNFSKKTLHDYEVISVIGNGTFGTCFKVRDKESSQIYAWKVIHYDELNESHQKALETEIRVLRQLQHPNIVQYFHHLVNHEAKSIFIVMEYCEGGDLAQLIAKAKLEYKRFEESYIWRVLFQICRALLVCHNKIKEGTILHRDIKPANIFLDTEGNAKLGDFGLARLFRRNETFTDTLVGTPYYMSTKIFKGSKYDRKSDVWAVGCLIYEMCSLRPPLNSEGFIQLSMNISAEKFSSIPDIYSKDLQDVIAYTLEVKNAESPNIEELCRHPLLIRNINELGNHFPVLVDIESQQRDFYDKVDKPTKLECSPLQDISSTTFAEQNSFNEEYGQRRLSITNIFTPDLKYELFYSAKRKIFPVSSRLQFSDPELYETIRREDCCPSEDAEAFKQDKERKYAYLSRPYEVTRHVFNDILQERLKAIRAQESLLRQREENLNAREQQLNEKEKRLIAFEQSLESKRPVIKEGCINKANILALPNSTNKKLTTSLPIERQKFSSIPPPVPPKHPTEHDDTYCSIESNDTSLLHQPTMAKLNMAAFPTSKAFPSLRKVTFQSPKKFFSHHTKNKKQKSSIETGNNSHQTHSTTSSKSSEESSESATAFSSLSAPITKRKSILSIFGLSRNNKETTNSATILSSSVNAVTTTAKKTIKEPKDRYSHKQKECIVFDCKPPDVTTIWSREHKRAAFEMLAAMNAAESSNNGHHLSNAPRHKIHQPIRNRNSLQRSCLRRTLPAPLSSSQQRDQIII